ncbi:hypothetical protein AMECASPLE_038881 [Ameca splendens]|uniref:Uncharacterized protein n=1 Tax=Ameca splendens TaxID=208324 RepID=A0ABV0ZU48_9TELE
MSDSVSADLYRTEQLSLMFSMVLIRTRDFWKPRTFWSGFLAGFVVPSKNCKEVQKTHFFPTVSSKKNIYIKNRPAGSGTEGSGQVKELQDMSSSCVHLTSSD